MAFMLMLCALAAPAAADTALTVLNDCSDPSQFTASPGMIFGANTESPDGKALEIEYEYALTFNLKSNVAKEQRAADADKEYLCFWIKTPYSECDSGIFIGLKEEGVEGNIDMIWNGNEAGYSGNIITVDKNGKKSYTKAGRLLVLKPGFEGYVAIPMKTALARHPGWGNNGDKTFDFAAIDEIQIWFDGSHAAYDEKYAFDNFTLAADENAFISMVTATGLAIAEDAPQTPSSTASSEEQTSSDTTPDDSTGNEQQPVASSGSSVGSSGSTVTSGTVSSGTGSNTAAFIIVAVVVVLGLAAAMIFIYKPKFIFKEKAAAAEATEEASTESNEE